MIRRSEGLKEIAMEKNNNKPKLRFPGFTDPWKQYKLNECIETSNEKNSDDGYTKYDVLSVSGDFGIVNQIEFQGRSFAGASVSNYGVVNTGSIVYTKSPLKRNPFGIIKTNKGKSGIVSTLYAVYKPKQNTNPNFVQCYNESDYRLNNYLKPLVNKGAKNDMKVSDDNALLGLVVFLSYEEQTKISVFLETLDNFITIHQRKLNHLQDKKKSLLQRMFPKNCEDFPELRFPQFTDPWEQHKLGKMLNLLKDGTHGSHKDVDEGVYLLSAKNIKNGNILIDSDSERKISNRDFEKIHRNFIIQKNDVLMTIVGTIGECAKVENPHNITFQRSVAYLRANEKLSSDFLLATIKADNFQSELKNRQSISAQPGIYLGELAEICISIPNKEEQFIIGTFFNNIDNLITLHQRKLNHLKEQKKAFLQQMFI